MQISQNSNILEAIDPTTGAAGVGNLNGATIDTQNKDGVLLVANFGTIVAGAVTSIKAQQGDKSDASDMADVAGSTVVVPDTGDDNPVFIDIYKPQHRYVRIVVLRATQNSTVSATAITYDSRYQPTAAGGASGVALVSP